MLTWATASETNNAGFEIERNVDGSWEPVTFLAGTGTTTQPQRYRYADPHLPYTAETVVYRLKQIDTDGRVHYSEERTVARSAVEAVRLLGTYPNPARSRATVRFAIPDGAVSTVRSNPGESVTLRLYDVLGRQVQTVRAGREAGRHEVTLDTRRLPSGTYFLRLRVGSTTQTQQVTVVK